MLKLENYGYVDRDIVKDQSKKKTAYAHIRRSDIEDVVQRLSYSDWLVLFYIHFRKLKSTNSILKISYELLRLFKGLMAAASSSEAYGYSSWISEASRARRSPKFPFSID